VHDSINHFLADPAYAQVAVLATSRIVGYHPTGLLAELPRLTISPLLDEDVERLLTAWFRQTSADNPDRLVDRMRRRLAQDARMAELATNPLLLTVLALLLARNRELPNEHAQLYAAATETLLYSWPVESEAAGCRSTRCPGGSPRWRAGCSSRPRPTACQKRRSSSCSPRRGRNSSADRLVRRASRRARSCTRCG
jgi:hypothetical protein